MNHTPLLFDETLIVNEAQVPTGLLCEVVGEYYITIFVIFLLYYQLYYNTIFYNYAALCLMLFEPAFI